jgi:sugar lactone lactonase YvrE
MDGNIYAALPAGSRKGVAVYNASGKEIGFIPVPGGASNLAFGRKPNGHTLYITGGENLHKIQVAKEGFYLSTRE